MVRAILMVVLAVGLGATLHSAAAAELSNNEAEPSNNEQYLLELTNRMRVDPQGELDRLVNLNYGSTVTFDNPSSDNSDVRNAITSFAVSASTLAMQWSELTPVPPVAWNLSLGDSATTYSNVMIAADSQAHDLDDHKNSDGSVDLPGRFIASGYQFNGGGWAGENIFAFTQSPDHAHSAFVIDWGTSPTGIQDPPGHRDLILDGRMREIGIGIVAEGNSQTSVGPLVVTQHFAVSNGNGPFLTGVAYTDSDGDAFYTPGEGLGEITIVATRRRNNQDFVTTTWASGGYSLELFAGDRYDIVASGPAIGQVSIEDVLVGADNIKIDFVPSSPPLAGDVTMDRVVDRADLALLSSNFGRQDIPLWGDGDLNFDGSVDLLDLAILRSNFGSAVGASPIAVPEPASASLALLALCCLGFGRRLRFTKHIQ